MPSTLIACPVMFLAAGEHKKRAIAAMLATKYLRTTAMSVDDIAMLVSFSDTANFRRAYKRWFGGSPSDTRTAASPWARRPA